MADKIKPYRPETNVWLLVMDPTDFTYDELERRTSISWNRVTDYLSLKYLRDMDEGDQALIFHSGSEMAIVGVARVASDPYPAPEGGDPAQVAVDLEPERRLESPVRLAELEDAPEFQELELVSQPEVTVMPVPSWLWDRIEAISHEHLAGVTQGEDLL